MIDAHCHFWRLSRGDYGWLDGTGGPLEPLRRDFEPGAYPGFARGVQRVIAVQAAPTVAETRHLLALAATEPRIAAVVGWVDLSAPDAVATITELAANPRLRGVRPMLQDIADTEWLIRTARPDAIEALVRHGLCLDALITERHLPILAEFAAAYPGLALVIDHAAKPQPDSGEGWADGMAALAAMGSVYCKLSGLVTELSPKDIPAIIARLTEWFGATRLIWGSDWPVLTLAAQFDDWLALTESCIAPHDRAAIMGENAARFYGVMP